MEEVVAVAVTLNSGDVRYFLTWGRVLSEVDPKALEDLVLRYARDYDLGGRPVSAEVCRVLREAIEAPYFFEGLIEFAREPRPEADAEVWRTAKRREMLDGWELYYLGNGWPAAAKEGHRRNG